MASKITASIKTINPNSIISEGYELLDQNIIPNESIITSFIPFVDVVEFWAYDINNNLIGGNNNLLDYNLTPSPTSEGNNEITLTPLQNAIDAGYDIGKINVIYNFVHYHLSSSFTSKYYLSEISSDRTEIRLKSNTISNDDISKSFDILSEQLLSSEYFDEFYIGFGDNEYHIGVNTIIDTSQNSNSILIKLYDSLPPQYNLKDEVVVVTKPAESIGYQLDFPQNEDLLLDVTYIQGPNTNLEINDFVNNSTELKSKSELLSSTSKTSNDNLRNILNNKGIKITPNYSYDTFNEFVNFSSAKKRIENFIEKVKLIETYESDIETLNSISGPTLGSSQVTSSISSINTKIENLIKNFDGYEYYLYYSSGSFSYPKLTSTFPYELYPSNDVVVSTWLGSDVENSQYYGGIILSSSLYDNNNQNWLYYTIPEFIRDNDNNNQYLEFSNMVGQHFDEIWLYTQQISEKLNTTSDIFDGVPLGLAEEAIKSLGFKGYGSNISNQDNYIGLIGENDGNYLPPTGSEIITNYIAVNSGEIINYWGTNTSATPSFPYALDQVNKEIFKRLYHNMSYLVKKKGTVSGLRQLINIWGIPNTILRINEFGGKNKDDINDYDLWYNRYSYAYNPLANQSSPSSSVLFPWLPLERNRIAEGQYIVPDSLQFRFKTTGIPSSGHYTQSLLVKSSEYDDQEQGIPNFDFGIALYYNPPPTGSYSGSSSNEYENWGTMKFYISGLSADGGVATSNDIYLPFFDKGWWTLMLQRDTHVDYETNNQKTTYTLYAKNKIYNGFDGNSIGFEGSASITSDISESINQSWNSVGTTEGNGIYLGGNINGSQIGDVLISGEGGVFSGSFQEFRYYSSPLSESIFNDFVMNPESIEGINLMGSLSSFDILNFRAPLGNELESLFTSSLSSSYTEQFTSLHPSVNGASNILITSSFVLPETNTTSSNYTVFYFENNDVKTFSEANTEVYFLDQPSIGVRNRISNKIQIEDTNDYGNILSSQISIQQDYQISRSYTEDINSLEVAFSPQDEINDDIIQSFGYGAISNTIADPREISSSSNHYPQLKKLAADYFKKYSKGNIYDYIRLIKYFDTSIFKAIKNYVPARTSVSTGIIIKQHLLERNRYNPPKITQNTQIAIGSEPTYNSAITLQNLELTTSLPDPVKFNGGTGGVVEQFNYSGSPSFGQASPPQSWTNNIITPLGLVVETEDKQQEFYNGDYSGSILNATTQSLFENPFKYQNVTPIELNVTFSAITGSGGDLNPLLNPTDPPDTVPLVTTQEINNYISEVGEIAPNSAIIIYQNIEVRYITESTPPFSDQLAYIGKFVGAIINSSPIGKGDRYLNSTLSFPPTEIIIPLDSRIYKLDFTDLNSNTAKFRDTQFNFILKPEIQTRYITSLNFSNQLPSTNNQPLLFNPFIVSEGGVNFQNSEYFATPNNYNENRKNTFIYDLDFSQGGTSPQNRVGVISGSATRVQTPNSNYTSRRSIIPRYLGSRLQSANYNFYTPSGSINPQSGSIPEGVLPYFLNGDSGSWGGDKSYGNSPVININPIYIAQFKKSYQNPQIFNSITFTLDSLIEIPRQDIKGTNFQPVTLKIEDNNERLYDVVSTFSPKRKASYTILQTVGTQNIINIPIQSFNILNSSTDIKLLGGTQFDPYITLSTMSFTENQLLFTTSSTQINDLRNITSSLTIPFMVTSSGALILKGETKTISFDTDGTPLGTFNFSGPGLALLHSLNVSTELGLTTEFDPQTTTEAEAILFSFKPRIGYPSGSTWDPSNPNNYFKFDPDVDLRTYQNYNLPFIIKRGDEIRVSYGGGRAVSNFNDLKTITFTVHGVVSSGNSLPFLQSYLYEASSSYQNQRLTLSDKILVTPDPSTLTDPIPSGSIHSFTIIRKQDDESKVTLEFPNSQYIARDSNNSNITADFTGYLIPNDLSATQKTNINTVLNILRSQNSGA